MCRKLLIKMRKKNPRKMYNFVKFDCEFLQLHINVIPFLWTLNLVHTKEHHWTHLSLNESLHRQNDSLFAHLQK